MHPAPLNGQFALEFANEDGPPLVDQPCQFRLGGPLRPIHYLGSKLRIVGLVRGLVNEIDGHGGPVCDLFAGSGTVSRELSNSRIVIAVDIQEYSRVLCSALLKPARIAADAARQFLHKALSSEHARSLSWAIEPMVRHEMNCWHDAEAGEAEPLCQLLEHASIIGFQLNASYVDDPALLSALTEAASRLREVDLSASPGSMTTRYFGGTYFSYMQASQIDMLLEAVASLPASQKDTVLAAVLSTASEIVNTVGKQFAQPIRPRYSDGRPKADLCRRIVRDRLMDPTGAFKTWLARYGSALPPKAGHRVIRGDYVEALNGLAGQVSLVYADPPYTRDHYSRYYHVLETLCLRDCPTLSTVRVNGRDQLSRGIYRTDRHQSPFCIKSKAPDAFATLFGRVRALNVPLILSYSPYERSTGARPRLMCIDDITDLARQAFSTVEVVSAGRIAHSKLNRSDMNKGISYSAETFVVCRP